MGESRAFANWVMVILLVAIAGAAMGIPVCNIESTQLNQCLPAVSGQMPQAPTPTCCAVVRGVDIPCLCRYRNYLPIYGINPSLAFALPRKCGIKTKPPCA